MDLNLMNYLYESIGTTGLLTEEQLVKEINSPGVSPKLRKDLLYRLWTLHANHFDLA